MIEEYDTLCVLIGSKGRWTGGLRPFVSLNPLVLQFLIDLPQSYGSDVLGMDLLSSFGYEIIVLGLVRTFGYANFAFELL